MSETDLNYDNYFGEEWEDEDDTPYCSFGFGGDNPCSDYFGRLGIEECEFECPYDFIRGLSETWDYMKNPWNRLKLWFKQAFRLRLNWYEQEHLDEEAFWKA